MNDSPAHSVRDTDPGLEHELRRANEQLRQSEERYRTLINEIEDYAIYRTDTQGRPTTWNEGVKRVLGFDEAEFIGLDLSTTIFTKEDQETGAAQRELDQAAAAGKVINDRWMVRRDGTRFYATGITTALRDPAGNLIGFTKVKRDQTEAKRLEEALEQRNIDLSEADRRKNEFLAMLAHELRNPLAPMMNAMRIIQMAGGDPETLRTASGMMERQIGQMVRLVDDLLDVNRISRGTIELRKARIELASVVAHALEAVRPQVEARAQQLHVSLPSHPVHLNGDPARLTQVVGNLLNNASKFTEERGTIELAVARAGARAVIRVRDNGIGIPADQIPLIFGMFVQVDSSLGRAKGGIGMGLTLVKQLVELHEGTVEATSPGPGKGSEFVVTLPRLPDPPGTAPASTRFGSTAPGRARRILIVDDDRDAAESLAAVLGMAGHMTEIAPDGFRALDRARAFLPDLVLLDIGLPRLDGDEVARRIRGERWGDKMVLVALTEWGHEYDRERSRAAGFHHHLIKPVRHDTLIKLLDGLE
ncbi:MAG TPA: ATP-binding protein [Gemmatimonadales bacterium]|nr:ATP-binding protein [Gemmatimonadales bacterium]